MRRHDHDSDRLTDAGEYVEDAPPAHQQPPNPGATPLILRERPVRALSLPLDALSDQEVEARRNLEHVGIILQRLEREQAEIIRLRRETRAILAELAA
jgi:hypothetical protein